MKERDNLPRERRDLLIRDLLDHLANVLGPRGHVRRGDLNAIWRFFETQFEALKESEGDG